MRNIRAASLAIVGVILGTVAPASVHYLSAAESPRSELAPTGPLRVAFPNNPLTMQKNAATGELGGLIAEFGRALSQRIDALYQPVEFENPRVLIETGSGQWDVTLLTRDPERANVVDFGPTLIALDYVFYVPKDSAIRRLDDVDRVGVRVGVLRGLPQHQLLQRFLKAATLVELDNPAAAVKAMESGTLQVLGGNRGGAQLFPSARILEEAFGVQELALALPKGRPASALAYVQEFTRQAIASGLVKEIIDRTRNGFMRAAS